MIISNLNIRDFEDAHDVIRQALVYGSAVKFGYSNYTFVSDVIGDMKEDDLMPYISALLSSQNKDERASAGLALDDVLSAKLDQLVKFIIDAHSEDIEAEIAEFRKYGYRGDV